MKNITSELEDKVSLLKLARLKVLSLHKALIDEERLKFEKSNGQITSGQFLNLLLNEPDFQWLRKFSTLIVEIDEMFDLDDGFNQKMIEDQLTQMRKIINFESDDIQFKDKFKASINTLPAVALKYEELKSIL